MYHKNEKCKFFNVYLKPWGHKEWSGDWGDNSDRWTEELKVLLKVENKDDGIFWMSKVDFVTQFNSVLLISYLDLRE